MSKENGIEGYHQRRSPEQENYIYFVPRELDILQCIIEGLENREIGPKLGICYHTVKVHIQNITDKVGLAGDGYDRLALAIVLAVQRDLLDTSHLPAEPKKPLTEKEESFIAMLTRGLRPIDIRKLPEWNEVKVSYASAKIKSKLGLRTLDQTVAWATSKTREKEALAV